jgi:hypothetical protein
MAEYLHDHNEFEQLIRIVAEEQKINPFLVEKDYWIMHVLHGLTKHNYQFELKGGTSLSKAYKIIERFSEDIDIHIKPPDEFGLNENPKNIRKASVQGRKKFYDWLASQIDINGIIRINRDTEFDETKYYRSGGIRLSYQSHTTLIEGVKEGILLEAGFDRVTPNEPVTISSWAFDKGFAVLGNEILDNRAREIYCYHPGYTFVEKLQTISTKYRSEIEGRTKEPNFMRQYYDVARLLDDQRVIDFIGTDAYLLHKQERFPKPDFKIAIRDNKAFILNDEKVRAEYGKRYTLTKNLYYKGQPSFQSILDKIKLYIELL